MVYLPGVHQAVKHAESLRHVIDIGRWTMELDQVECFGLEVDEAPFHERGKVVAVVSLGDVWIETATDLGCDVGWFSMLATKSCQKTLAAAVTITIGGIEEVDPQLGGPVKSRQ